MTLLLFKIFSIFAKISYFCFGGYAMIPLINQEMGNLHWMTPTEVANLFAMAEMLPGSVVVNMSTYCGIRQAGIPGALAGALGVMMPSLTVGLLAAHYLPKVKDGFWVSSALYGLRPVTVAMIFLTVVSLVPTSFFLASGELSVRSLSIAGAVLGAALAFKADTVVQVSIGAVLGILLM